MIHCGMSIRLRIVSDYSPTILFFILLFQLMLLLVAEALALTLSQDRYSAFAAVIDVLNTNQIYTFYTRFFNPLMLTPNWTSVAVLLTVSSNMGN